MTDKIARQYKQSISEYKKTRKEFIDDEFPPNRKSVGILSEKIKGNIKWLRPPAIKCYSKVQQDWSVCEDISPSNVTQGALGDCWFVSSIATVASKPQLVRKLILTQGVDPAGVYILRLFKDGVWKTVIVDDLLPCDESNCPVFAQAKGKQLWVSLLEKAQAKLYGSYHALKNGSTYEGLISLTGSPTQTINFKHEHKPLDSKKLGEVWQTLLSYSEEGFLIGITCGSPEVSEQEYEAVGLISEHAYSVLQVRSIRGLRLLQLRNPWGKHSWKGDWSLGSRLWTSELLEKLNPSKENDGTFWISFQDTVKYFPEADVCRIRPTWQDHRFEGIFTNSESQSVSYYQILVTTPTEMESALYQPSKRSLSKDAGSEVKVRIDMCLLLLSLEDTRNGPPKLKRYIDSSPRGPLEICVIERLRNNILQPGLYALIPISIKSLIHNRAKNTYALSTHSSAEIQVQKKEAPLEFLTDSIVAFATQSGEKKDHTKYFKFYQRWKWHGGILVAENKHLKKHLRVSIDMSASKNIYSSRTPQSTKGYSGMETWDVIPPSSRQILAIVSPSSIPCQFGLSYTTTYQYVKKNSLGDFGPGKDGRGKCHLPELESTIHHPRQIL